MTPHRLVIAGLIFLAGAIAGAAAVLACGNAPRMRADVLLDVTTDELRWAKTAVRAHLDHWEPDSETGTHSHSGPALIYVFEGQLEETSAAGTRTLKAGQVVWNRARTEHNVRNRTQRMARALAIHLEPAR